MTFERNIRYGLQGTQMTTLVVTPNENYLFLFLKTLSHAHCPMYMIQQILRKPEQDC